jgi:capsular exopolysaccharide synthesis family protein
MGKVYDALRRAEEERSRRVGEASASGVPRIEPLPNFDSPEAPAPAPAPGPLRRARSVFVPADGVVSNKRRIAVLQPESPAAEQFRSLRARLDALAKLRPLRTIAVTSALRGDGKTMSAISLAVVSAMQLAGRVLLVDCDLREPAIGAALGLRLDAGLAEVLTDGAPLEQAIQRADGTALDVLAVRGLPQNPAELLASEAMRKLVESLTARYDRVVFDLPPTLGLPDAKTVSGLCDATLFVVRADATPAAEIETALDVLGRERVIGIVMNGADPASSHYGVYDYGVSESRA